MLRVQSRLCLQWVYWIQNAPYVALRQRKEFWVELLKPAFLLQSSNPTNKIFGLTTEKERGRRKLHNEERHNLCFSLNVVIAVKSNRMKYCVNGADKNWVRYLVGKPECKKGHVGDHLYRWVYFETDGEYLDEILLTQDRAQWRALVNILRCRDQLSDYLHLTKGLFTPVL